MTRTVIRKSAKPANGGPENISLANWRRLSVKVRTGNGGLSPACEIKPMSSKKVFTSSKNDDNALGDALSH